MAMNRFQSSVTNDPGCLWPFSRRRRAAPRRGNTIVLVVGILVLLVIIATAYISRTHAGRVTSLATQRATLRDDNAQVIADSIASEIAEALFVRPIDPTDPALATGVADPSYPHLAIRPDALRYGVDPNDANGDLLSDFPYNFAPFQVVPFSNWPDEPPGTLNPQWPQGPGSPDGLTNLPPPFNTIPIGAGNPLGEPGTSDTRWLADIEPLRWDTDLPPDGILDTFSHWRHMTNIARPGNGWRIVGDISDVESLLVIDLSIPVEQQLAIRSDALNTTSGLPSVPLSGMNFFGRWQNWFGGPGFGGYPVAYTNTLQIPPNFLDLKDLNGNLNIHEAGERPEDEFIGPSSTWPFGTPRWNVLRVLADTDGDGFTDSFWFLAPTMIERGIRQVVAVRIIDNSAMLNANVATRFFRNDSDFAGGPHKTRGQTPADLALVGQLGPAIPADTWNVGIYDNASNWFLTPQYGQEYTLSRWDQHVAETGIGLGVGNPSPTPTTGQRLEYWRRAGLLGLSPAMGAPQYTPFTLADELELRMFQGNNYPWIFSRYEYSTQGVNAPSAQQYLRATLGREESTEYLKQLSNTEVLRDNRRKLTLFNGARNDLMPPWLRWRWDQLPPGAAADYKTNQGLKKLDLREPEVGLGPPPPPGVLTFRQRLAPTLLLALIDGDGTGGDSYFGPYTGNPATLRQARLAAAGLAANIREYRDEDSDVLLSDAEPLPALTAPGPAADISMLGMEKQPFLVEAFIGHIYKAILVDPPLDPQGDPYTNAGNNVVIENPAQRSTVIVVQIANPYDQSIDLNNYQLSVFGQTLDLNGLNLTLQPATEGMPRTAIFYAIKDTLQGDALETKWLEFFDITPADLAPASSVQDVSLVWDPADRNAYDNNSTDGAIELLRRDPVTSPPVFVLVDRIDPPNDRVFGNAVNDLGSALGTTIPVNPLPPGTYDVPSPAGGDYPGIDLGVAGGSDHWVQWVRVTRAWGFDDNADAIYDASERNPRYVFGNRAVVTPTAAGTSDGSFIADGNKYKFGDNPDSPNPWFARDYQNVDGLPVTDRKPTFFDMNHANDLLNPDWSYPDKGWYGQSQPGQPGSVDQPANASGLDFAMQMLQKDGDFEQVGELLNVWLFGHELGFDIGGNYVKTNTTFSEFMSDSSTGPHVNRLRGGEVIGIGEPTDLLDPRHAVPALPAGIRVLDAFVCDDRGVALGATDQDAFLNAHGFSGKTTPGLININTAPPEVMRALPHMTRMVHELNSPALNPYVRLPEAIVQYRERFGDPTDTSDPLPPYGNRGAQGGFMPGLRPERGMASPAEVMLLENSGNSIEVGHLDEEWDDSWRVDFAALRPAALGTPGGVQSTQISTDVIGSQPDNVATDAEERNLLFAGISNLITTRSDMFTVYFKVRSFRQNRVTGIWDATDPEYIVDDSRYVMLVDRSEVNRPTDKPKILYLEKLPK